MTDCVTLGHSDNLDHKSNASKRWALRFSSSPRSSPGSWTSTQPLQDQASVQHLALQPDKFVEEPTQCQGFLFIFIFFAMFRLCCQAGRSFRSVQSKVLTWATMVWKQGSEPLTSYDRFIALFCHVLIMAWLARKLVRGCWQANGMW